MKQPSLRTLKIIRKELKARMKADRNDAHPMCVIAFGFEGDQLSTKQVERFKEFVRTTFSLSSDDSISDYLIRTYPKYEEWRDDYLGQAFHRMHVENQFRLRWLEQMIFERKFR